MKISTKPIFCLLAVFLSGCGGNIKTEIDQVYQPAIDVVKCEEYGGLSGSWVKCTFKNKTSYPVNLDGMEAVCYRGEIKVSDRVVGGTVDPGGLVEESLICGGSGINLVKFRQR
ncbi:hypothetical protein [Massilia sp. Root335]|jgi:hypothetical protein|uniref:hypothetical protein n=1 Tax=Massilia sp. Root335 TaxID=1736517 RepID=UPI000ADD1946|nr:hypothetical protein [Massilia sp. Root335]